MLLLRLLLHYCWNPERLPDELADAKKGCEKEIVIERLPDDELADAKKGVKRRLAAVTCDCDLQRIVNNCELPS